MANQVISLHRMLQARSAEALASIEEAWAVDRDGAIAVSPSGQNEADGLEGELQDVTAARFAWASLSLNARDLLHQMITFEVMDGAPREELQKLARLTDADFAAALDELEQRAMLGEVRPNTKVKRRLETRGQQASAVLAIPIDFHETFTTIDNEIYGSGDRSKLPLVDLLEELRPQQLQTMLALSSINRGNFGLGFYSFSYDAHSIAENLAGKLVQANTIEVAWEQLDLTEQKMCRWLCRADGDAAMDDLQAALNINRPQLRSHLRALRNHGLVFDTFSGQQHRVFMGRGVFKVLRRLIGEIEQMEEKAKSAPKPEQAQLQEAPPIVHEAHGQLLFDIAIVVGAAYQMVIEPTQAGRVPKRLANKIFPRLHGSRYNQYEGIDNYLDMVFGIAESLGLIAQRASAGQKARYVPGKNLEEWANLDTFEQARRLLQFWENPQGRFWSDVAGVNYRPYSPAHSFGYYTDQHAARLGLLAYLAENCRPGQWYSLEPFLQTIKARKPLLLRERSRYSAYSSIRTNKDLLLHWEQSDGEMIIGILASSLHELGLVNTGYLRESGDKVENPVAFQLTDLAAQTLWNTPNNEVLPDQAGGTRALIVQPNFELLLLQPDYPTLYCLLPFARVEQVDMVSRLTLTQESVRRGVEAGNSVEQTLQTLRAYSQKELPQNVLYTLQDWGRLYKNATISQIILLEVSEESVADEICASPKLRSLEPRRLGPRAIAVGSQVSLQVLRSTLEKEGVILSVQGEILTARDYATTTYSGYGRRR